MLHDKHDDKKRLPIFVCCDLCPNAMRALVGSWKAACVWPVQMLNS